ncbi:MAG: tetratricopeptide repeat protein [Sulfuricaulis sp.]
MDKNNRNPALLSKAISLHQAGHLNEAEALCRTMLSSDSAYFPAMTLLGTILLQRGSPEEAIRLFGHSLEINPMQPDALYCQGIALHGMRRHNEALASYDRAIRLVPDFVQAHNNRGLVLEDLKRHDEALASYGRAIALNPRHANAYSNRGNILNKLAQYDAALASYDRAIEINPGNANACFNRGIALSKLKQHGEALASYDRAIALNPGYAKAYNNRGLSLATLKRHDEALASFSQTIALDPGFVEAYTNRGNALRDMKRYDEAFASYNQAIVLKPDDADVYLNKAYLKILLGEYEEGWKLHEWRWKHNDKNKAPRSYQRPLWLGQESLTGKTILLHTEQGIGDSIQFCRYATMVEALGAKVMLEVPQPLVALFSTLKDSIRVIPMGNPVPDFDWHCPLMSLPLAFRTTVSTIPANIPYLRTDADKQRQWHSRMGARNKPRIGLVWSGNPGHANDHNRSIPLDLLTPLFGLDLEFHCIQKEIRQTDREILNKHRQIRLYESDLGDFSDTAALVTEMNLVISVDTSVVHLAGALGKPVWILLPFSPDHRWMTEREDSPWYPTARLFRQPQAGDWAGIVKKVVADLSRFV